MSTRNLLLRQESEESTHVLASSPSISSLNRLRDTFRRTESQLSSIVSNAASAASGAVLGTSATGAASEASSASVSQVSTPTKQRKPGKLIICIFQLLNELSENPTKTIAMPQIPCYYFKFQCIN
uniref:Uncharacterized protein n=1 Tax=Glossina austeni TaxID=7395 RepID=A0A1A9V3F9_GLOAU